MKSPHRTLLVFSLLLLLPMSALKWWAEWRQEHPPLSRTDQKLRASLTGASRVSIGGAGPLWQRLTKWPKNGPSFLEVKGRARQLQLAEALRTLEYEGDISPFDYTHFLVLLIEPKGHHNSLTQDFVAQFNYVQDGGGSYLQSHIPGQSLVRVQPRFVARFEALVTELAQEARRKRAHSQSARTPAP